MTIFVLQSAIEMGPVRRKLGDLKPCLHKSISDKGRNCPSQIEMGLKRHSQLLHMRIRYHFIANLHITLHLKKCV